MRVAIVGEGQHSSTTRLALLPKRLPKADEVIVAVVRADEPTLITCPTGWTIADQTDQAVVAYALGNSAAISRLWKTETSWEVNTDDIVFLTSHNVRLEGVLYVGPALVASEGNV